MVYYKPVKITFDVPGLVKVILTIVICYHSFSNLIITNRGSLFISKFWLLLCYFFGIKYWLFIVFYLQIDSQTKGVTPKS